MGLFDFLKKKPPEPVIDPEEEKRRQAEEREERMRQAEAAFSQRLAEIPEAPAEISPVPAPHNRLGDIGDYTFSNITKRTSMDRLGDFVVVDVETTGIYPSQSEIVEIAAVRFEDFEPAAKFVTLCAPKKPIDPEAAAVNGITEEMIAGKPRFDQIAASLQAFIGASSIVGHNLEFDLRFLWHYGVDFFQTKRKYYDTLDLAHRTLKKQKYKYDKDLGWRVPDYDSDYDVEDYKLETLCGYYGIPFFGSHRALADAYATGRLFQCLAEDRTDG